MAERRRAHDTLSAGSWTLVGGLMTQLHTIHHGLGVVRPTNDVDIVLHIETIRGVPNKVATALEALGYEFQPSIDLRNNTAHRFVCGTSTVDLVTDSRDRERHIFDAAALLACIDDPFAERAEFTGSDRRRIATLVAHLDEAHPAWRALPVSHRTQAQLTLDILARTDE